MVTQGGDVFTNIFSDIILNKWQDSYIANRCVSILTKKRRLN